MRIKLDASNISSSLLKRIEFVANNTGSNDLTGTVKVTYNNNSMYLYNDVPFVVALDVILAKESVGSKFTSLIKSGGFSYMKL